MSLVLPHIMALHVNEGCERPWVRQSGRIKQVKGRNKGIALATAPSILIITSRVKILLDKFHLLSMGYVF